MNLLGSDIKLRQLQVFREVVRAGSERLAAQALRITQPAVSQNIGQLEGAVGFALFMRDNGRLRPTEQAWDLLREIDAAFAGLDRLGKSINGIRGGERRALTIAAPNAFSMRLLPMAVKRLRAETTIRTVQIRAGSYQDINDHVHHGRADIGISRLPVDPRLFDNIPVAKAVNVCMFSPGHRFAALEVVTPEDLVGEALVDIDPQFSAHQMNVNAMRFSGVDPDIAVEYDAYGHDAGFVAAGVGVSITNEILAREYRRFELKIRRFEPGATYHYVVLWQKDRSLGIEIRSAIDLIAESFAA